MPEHTKEHREPERGKEQSTIGDLKGKTILSLDSGEKLGQVDDVLVDPNALRVSGLLVNRGNVLDRDTQIITMTDIDRWGRDAVLVRDANVFKPETDVHERENWLSASDKLKGLSVVSTDGERLGKIDEVLIDGNGQILAFRISEGMSAGRFGEKREIPAHATQKIGDDVAIVDVKRKP